jgi:hypothetical protein
LRKVILHYHLFKNAGTSVDVLLEQGFPGRWVTREFPVHNHEANVNHVGLWVQTQRDAVVFSSHTALMPPPAMPGVECFPIMFVRHPLDRLASVYAFERNQGGDEFGAVLARNTSLAGYVETRLAMPYDRQCRNFHAWRLAHLFQVDDGTDRERALLAVDTLPFVGLVERYNASVARMVAWLQPHFPAVQATVVAANVSRDHSITLDKRLAGIEAELGASLYARVLEANADDLAIHQAVGERYAD